MHDIRAVITDLDGTIVDEAIRVSPATVQAATDLAAQRIPLIIATARGPAWVAQFAELMPAVRVAVCCGGAVGWLAATQELLWRDTFAPHLVESIIRRVNQDLPEIGIAVFDAQRWQVNEEFARTGPTRRGPIHVVDANQLSEDPVCAMSFCYSANQRDQLNALLAEFEPPLAVHDPEPGITNIAPAGTDKARGVIRALGAVDVSPANAIAFGDLGIDLPMFAMCGYSVAMAGANPEVAAAATYLARCVHDDGFAHMLGQLGLARAFRPAPAPACGCPQPEGSEFAPLAV